MRRVDEIMKELGFKEGAPEGVQKAFIKNLIRAANGGAEVEDLQKYRRNQKRHQSKMSKKNSPGPNQEEQLSFQFIKKNG